MNMKEMRLNLRILQIPVHLLMHPIDSSKWKRSALKDASKQCERMTFPVNMKQKNELIFRILEHFCEIKCISKTKWKLTANVIVDSAFKTSTKTSASKQWLSIQSSRFGETSTPGESTNTTSSRSKLHRSRGQKIRIFELSHNFSWQSAFANCCTF